MSLALRKLELPAAKLEWREWRWIALLPDHVVFVAQDESTWTRLKAEARVIEAVAAVGVRAPEVLATDPTAWMQVRRRATGITGGLEVERRLFGVDHKLPPAARYRPDLPLTEWGERFARSLGSQLGAFCLAMSVGEAEDLGLENRDTDFGSMGRVLRDAVGDASLLRVLPRLQRWVEQLDRRQCLIHGDPHFNNLFTDEAGSITALLDFDGVAVGHGHEDLRYLHSSGPRFAKTACNAYAERSGNAVDPDVVGKLHVLSAFNHIGWVEPQAARFPSILSWARAAVQALAPEWSA